MEFLKDLWKKLAKLLNAFASAVKFLSSLASLLAVFGFISTIVGFVQSNRLYIFSGIAIFLVGAVVWVVIKACVRSRVAQERTADQIEYEYRILRKELTYEYFSDGKTMRQVKRFKIRAETDGMHIFTDRYRWSSTGKVELSVRTPGKRLVGPWTDQNMWDIYEVHWSPPLLKGATTDIEVRWDLYDDKNEAQPFYSTTIDKPTDYLHMTVILPPNLRPRHVTKAIYPFFTAAQPVKTAVGSYEDTTNEITWDIPKPKLGYRYILNWTL